MNIWLDFHSVVLTIKFRVKVTNTFDTEYTGTIYTYIKNPGTLVLQIPNKTVTQKGFNYKFIRTSHIKNLDILSKTVNESQVAKIQSINLSKIDEIIKRNKESVELINKTRNSNVSTQAQQIFDAVFKTIPDVQWGPNNSIIILDEVKIQHPYSISSIKSIDGGESGALDLIKKIVDGVWLKIENEKKGG
ncbi:hypothetical protein WICMUC_002202 [Wickerhamomyces mucosus]|uniref:AD domain-containing protein n=1 Tax=Wickerhamomyces mucosus TaxID=1378264 RepID=A0A9P8PR75_9ASCO|nr:hypothetical protein WICMUC_002202 [Wickerhamomyces mucosus]